MIVLVLIFCFSLLANVVLGILVFRASKRLLAFDDFLEMLSHDVDTNVSYLEGLTERPLVSNSEEVVAVHRNMQFMKKRFEEYSRRIPDVRNG